MGFFRDIMGGGGDLYNSLTPKELRNAMPREIQPGGFDPARDLLGYDIKANPERDAMIARQQQDQQAQQAFNQSGNSPIPMGMAPPQQQFIPLPGASGPYGAQAQGLLGTPTPQGTQPTPGSYAGQAQMLAGLLGQQPPMQPPFTPGRFMPGYRPGIDQPITNGSARGTGDLSRRIRQY